MRNCPKVSTIRVQLTNPRLLDSFFGASFNEWIELNFRENLNGSNRRDWLDMSSSRRVRKFGTGGIRRYMNKVTLDHLNATTKY
ncbi:hypothetical protein AHAS_Ahas09G0225000 [Arachis hypogaea]